MKFTNIKIQNMQSLSKYRKYLQQNPRLVYLFMELTNQCNLSCIHCGSNCQSANHTQLNFEWAKKALDSVAQKMTPQEIMVCFTGGEPMMYKHFYEIAAYVRDLGFSWGMTSNGTLINEAAVGRLAGCGMGTITISLDGLEKSHDWFRRSQGSFESTLRGIRALQNCQVKKIPLQITTVVHKQNIQELDMIYKLLTELGIEHWRPINIEPIGRANEHSDLLLEAEDYKYLLSYIRDKRSLSGNHMDITYGCSHYLTTEYEREVRDYYFICGAGIYVASIMCNGDIAACLDIERRPELVQGNVERDDFVDVWYNRFEIYRTDRTQQCAMCSTCSDKEFCHADSMHTWNFDEHSPNLCVKQFI